MLLLRAVRVHGCCRQMDAITSAQYTPLFQIVDHLGKFRFMTRIYLSSSHSLGLERMKAQHVWYVYRLDLDQQSSEPSREVIMLDVDSRTSFINYIKDQKLSSNKGLTARKDWRFTAWKYLHSSRRQALLMGHYIRSTHEGHNITKRR
jgi:hypothetical protein